ncbi:MAG: hypothetical protein KDA85_18695, partial [Planctomycetaceae bacterium]|nr:hypothetical protein [Planctomycetaceae bacterium]
AGPVTVTLRSRIVAAGNSAGSLSWRTPQAAFESHQLVRFTWPAGPEWQTSLVKIPEESAILHLRIVPPLGQQPVEIDSIRIEDKQGDVQNFDFQN